MTLVITYVIRMSTSLMARDEPGVDIGAGVRSRASLQRLACSGHPRQGDRHDRRSQIPAGPGQRRAEPAEGNAPLLQELRGAADHPVAAVRRPAEEAQAGRQVREI